MKNLYIGVDVGASKIAAGLVSGGKIIKFIKLPTDAKSNNKKIIENIVKAIKLVYDPKIKGIGIGFPGEINSEKGMVLSSPNFTKTFRRIKLRQIISQKFHHPVAIENDANCFALAESIYGPGKNSNCVIGLTLGTGIGGGIIINNQIYHGKDGLAGELGHTTIIQNGKKCSCGQKGHLEAYISGAGIAKTYKQTTGKNITVRELIDLINLKDKSVIKTIELSNEFLADGLANFINIFNPDMIVLGGGLSKAQPFVKLAIKKTRSKLIYKQLATTKIIISRLKDKSGILGASLLFKCE